MSGVVLTPLGRWYQECIAVLRRVVDASNAMFAAYDSGSSSVTSKARTLERAANDAGEWLKQNPAPGSSELTEHYKSMVHLYGESAKIVEEASAAGELFADGDRDRRLVQLGEEIRRHSSATEAIRASTPRP
jgi:hypothetical protein